MKNHNSQKPLALLKTPWSNNPNPIWLASTIGLHRNIEKYKFPGKLPSERKKQIVSLVGNDILAMGKGNGEKLDKPVLLQASEMDAREKTFLAEHFLTLQNFSHAGAGDAFIIDETGEFLAVLNLNDHIHLQLLETKGEMENALNRLNKIETQLGKAVNFSYSSKFGFLTADPTQCGTALVASIYMQVPGLVHSGRLDPFLEEIADDSLTITGIHGSPTEIIGDILVIQNNYTLGLTEEAIISSLRNIATKVSVEENGIRHKIKKKESADFKDKISRAYGILIHSYQIEAIEALNALSLIKLGIDAEWLSGIDNEKINALCINCRSSHLLGQQNGKVSQEQIPHLRAERIHEALKTVKLSI